MNTGRPRYARCLFLSDGWIGADRLAPARAVSTLLFPHRTRMLGSRLQPIVDLHTGDTLGCELLAGDRFCPDWNDAEWRTWYAQLGDTLFARTPEEMLIFLNVDAMQLCDPEIAGHIERAVLARPCVLEWTERHASPEQCDHAVNRLRGHAKQGVPIAVDDVGDGHDGIGRTLRVLPRYVKLSMGLVHRGRTDGGMGFLRHINDLFTGLGCAVIAEGIETPDDAARCAAAGIRYGQGFHFGSDRCFG